MGFFSWKTIDTNESIPNHYSNRSTFTVYMKDNKGNVWTEDNYEGYGVFGGKDYYELLAEMNGLMPDRYLGIRLEFPNEHRGAPPAPTTIFPGLFKYNDGKWTGVQPESCRDQGYFYSSDDEDEDDEYYGESFDEE